jgi:CRP-like cAMP-binding protein
VSSAKSEQLERLEFFQGLEPRELAQLAARSRTRSLDSGEALFQEGDPLEPALRFVLAGRLQIRKTARTGKETVIRLIGEGEVFGAAALFDRRIAPGAAIACEPTTVLEIHVEALHAFVADHPDIALKLLVTFAQRLRDSQDTLHAVVSGRARTRLARVILRTLDRDGGTPQPDGVRLKTRLPHGTLSRMVGVTYEECVRLISEWSHDHPILRYERGGAITLHDRARLEREAAAD